MSALKHFATYTAPSLAATFIFWDNYIENTFMKYFIKTYGCQMNMADSEAISVCLESEGFLRTHDIKEASIIILNTCSVRQLPEQKAYSFLGRAEPFKKKNPGIKIIVAGCMAQRAGKEIKKRFPIVDLVVGATEISGFHEILKNKLKIWRHGKTPTAHIPTIPALQASPVSAFVTIMRGCENFCSYCVVPFVRGPEISKPYREILAETRNLLNGGIKEVTLLGQNVNSYLDKTITTARPLDFTDLLREISLLEKLERVRFMTNHPKDLSDKLIAAMAEMPKVCEHLHLPLQSGSDRVLKAMNRGYTAKHYMSILDKAKARMPGLNITTDILVGFPGETEDDIRETLGVIKTAGFDSLFAFKYSARPGTAAAKIEDNVTLPEKEERLNRVLELGNGISCEKNAKLINSVQEVLVEFSNGGMYEGRTRSNKKVSFSSGIDLTGKITNVKIIDVKINSLTGKLEQVLR